MRSVIASATMFAVAGGLAGPAWAGYSFTTIDRPSAPVGTTILSGINDAGTVVGGSAGLGLNGFIDTNGSFTTVAVPGASGPTNADAISNNGQIAGLYFDTQSTTLEYLDSNGVFVSFDASNGLKLTAQVNGVNNSGQVIGYFYNFSATPAIDGYVWAAGVSTLINVPGAIATYPTSINDLGQITGSYALAQYYNVGAYHVVFGGYFEDVGGAITTSGSPFNPIPNIGDVPGATPGFTYEAGVNGEGQVVGRYYNGPIDVSGYPAMVHGFVATPTTAVPEPSAFSLFGVSLVVFGLCVSHRAVAAAIPVPKFRLPTRNRRAGWHA